MGVVAHRSPSSVQNLKNDWDRSVLLVPKLSTSPLSAFKRTFTASLNANPHGLKRSPCASFYLAFAIWFFAAATTFSGVKPYFFCSSFNGAEVPNVSIPML